MKRLTTTEVCAVARFSRATLWRRIRSGDMPAPVDHARQALFCAVAVERALTSAKPSKPTTAGAPRSSRRWSDARWKAHPPTP